MLVEVVISVNPNFSDFFPSDRSAFSNNLRSNWFSNVFSSVAPWYESTLFMRMNKERKEIHIPT